MSEIPSGFGQVAIKMTIQGQHQARSIWGVKFAVIDPPDQAETDTMSEALAATFIANCLSEDSTYDGVRIDLNVLDVMYVLESSAGADSGTGALEAVSPNVQGLIKKVTQFSGRKFRGRMFVPDLAESRVSGSGIVSDVAIAAMEDLGADIVSALNGDSWNGPVILHNDVTPPTDVLNLVVENKVATQRRRLER